MTNSIKLHNTVTGETIDVNTSTGEYWLALVDFGVVEAQNHTYKYVNQIGVYRYNTTLETRQIAITGWVAGSDLAILSEQKKKLNSFVNPQHDIEVWTGEYKLTFNPSSSVKYSTSYKENNEVMCKFLIQGTCSDPMFRLIKDREVSVAYTERKFHFPLIIPREYGIMMGIRQPSLIAYIENTGSIETGYILEFKATGEVVNPSIIDIGTQQFIRINKTIQAGEVIRVDTRMGERKVTNISNGVETNFFQYRDFDSSWLSLAVGENYLRYNADEGVQSLEVNIIFSPRFLEVES